MYQLLPRPTIFAHRGASIYAPENTIAAFELAVEQQADGIELDAKLCADGQIVVFHDQTVDRTSDGSGKVLDLSLAALKELDAGSWFGENFAGQAIPTLEEVFEAVGRFDERLPACEDYDLWLRVSCRYPVYLIDEPLIIKRGGHADQLSRAAGLDRYRIQALRNLIEAGRLSESQKLAAIKTLQQKSTIYAGGCRKRGRQTEADYYAQLAEKYQ